MINTTNISGTTSPFSLTLTFDHSRESNFSASDLTKLPIQLIQSIQQVGRTTYKPAINERGNILCLCEEKEQNIRGFFIGSLSFFLNEAIIQNFNCEGRVSGRIVEDEVTLKYSGVIRSGYNVYGEIQASVWTEHFNSTVIRGASSLFLSIEAPEKVIISPTSRFLPNTSYFPKENLRTTSYLWRESIDKEILSIWDEIKDISGDLIIDTARVTQIQDVFSRLLGVKNLTMTSKDLKKLWRATTKFLLIGPIVSGYEQALREFTGVVPEVLTVLDKQKTVVGQTRIGKSRLSSGLIDNTITIKLNNPLKLFLNKQMLSEFLRNVKPKHQRVMLILDTGEALEIL